MRYEDAGCDHPCGQEPMGCGTCDSAYSDNLVPNFDPGDHFSCNDFDSCDDCPMRHGCEDYQSKDNCLHDDRCTIHKGYECNCMLAVFNRKEV